MLTKAAPPAAERKRVPGRRRPPFWRNPLLLAALTVVVVVVAVFVGIANAHKSTTTAGAASQTVTKDKRTLIQAVTGIDPAVVAAVGNGGLAMTFHPVTGVPMLTGPTGKPEILYIGADYCPFCAAQRWALVVALSRFGTFSHLYLTQSASNDAFPDTATFTFHNAGYTSGSIDFVPVEMADRTGAPLQALTADQHALVARYDVPPYVPAASAGGIPWLDVANQQVMVSSGFTPAILAGLSWADIAEKLGHPGDAVAKGIIGDADNITAAICRATGMQPASVCTSAPIAPLVAALPS